MACMGQAFDWMCATEDMTKEASYRGGYEDTMYRPYIPYRYENSIPVQVNLVFLQKNDGTGGFQAGDSEQQKLLDEVEARINEIYATLVDQDTQVCFQWKDPFIADAKVRFVFNRMYVRDSYAWNRRNYGEWYGAQDVQCPPLNYIEYLQKDIENSDAPLGINVFFTMDSVLYETYQYCEEYAAQGIVLPQSMGGWGCSEFPDKAYSQIHMPDSYIKFLWMKYIVPLRDTVEWIPTAWGWERDALAAALAHELGHSLDLHHDCNHYAWNQCPDALMHQDNVDPEHLRNYIPPTEVGKIHYSLSTTRLKNFVRKDLLPAGTLEIEKDLLWNMDFRAYTHIRIAGGSHLRISSNVQMPRKSHIDVEGQMYIRNGNVECVMEDGDWDGIRVKNGGMLWLENTAISDYDIVLEPGSTLVLKGDVTVDNSHKIVIGSGCYVCAASDLSILGSAKPFVRDGSLYSGIRPGTSLLYSSPCSSTGWNRFIAASSTLPDILYVQNQQISTDQTFVAKEIVVGSNVTSSKPSGQVTIKNGAHATFISLKGTRFDTGFRCENGSAFTVLKMEE